VTDAEPKKAKPKTSGSDFFTDAGQADHLAEAVLLGRYIWVPELGWLAWTGTHWQEAHDAEVVERVKQHVRSKFREAVKAMGESDDTNLIDGWRSMLSAKRMTAALNLTRGIKGILVMGADLDEDRYLLNMADGTLDLRAGEPKPHDRRDHLTMVTPTGMSDTGDELWTGFLMRVQPDPEVRSFIQRLMGSALLGEVRDHVMPINTGEGANGKGVFRSTILHAIGPYGLEVDPALLIEQKHGRHLTFLMELRGKRVVFCSETSKGAKFNEAEMKRLVGGDPIQANRMRKDPITFLPSHTLLMVTNHLPNISGDDEEPDERHLRAA
jgi:putative DNA primase/helicase